MRGNAVASFLIAVGLAWPAPAQEYGESYRQCFAGGVPERVIAACSNLIAHQVGDRKDLAMALKSRGDAYDDTERYDLALKDYSEALARKPNDAEIFNSRGATRNALGQYELAIQDFDRALELVPRQAISLSNRCFAKAVLGRFVDALVDCNEAVRLRPARIATFGSRGFLYLKMGRADEAIADYERVLRKRADDPYALYGRGLARFMKGDRRGGDDDLVRALAIKPDTADYMARLGLHPGRPSDKPG